MSDNESTKQASIDEPQRLEDRARQLLQESAEQLDGRTRSRLTQARHAALEVLKQRERKSISWWLPASGVAAATALAVLLSLNFNRQPGSQEDPQLALAPVDELEIVTAEDSLEFYRDVEFYAWLDTVLEEEPAEKSGA